jgi:glycosyltransferase involved in cell wall biosynthesis
MKILQVIDTLNIGGAERMCVNISNLLTSKSVENSILLTRELGPLSKQVESDKIDVISKKSGLDLFGFYRFIKVIKAKSPDVLHAHSTSIYWAFVAKSLFPRIKLIWHDHLGSRPNQNNFLFNFLKKKIDIVLAINEFNYQWYLINTDRNPTNLYYLPNFPFLKNIKSQRDSDLIHIVHVANLHNPKDHFTHVRAISQLIKVTGIRGKIVVRFIGDFSDFNYVRDLRDLIENLNLRDVITLVGPSDDIAQEMFKADIGVLSSTSEGLPVSLLEYGLAGLAVVVTDVGQCSVVVGNGQFGRIVEKGNPSQMAEDLLHLIDNDEERSQLGEKFKCHIENEYGSELFYKNYITLID